MSTTAPNEASTERGLIDAAFQMIGPPDDEMTRVSSPHPEPPESLPPDSFTGYEIVREIHRGAQGVIYKAIQKSTKRKVAIKVIREGPFADDRERARFEREVQILGQLQRPNIVAIHDSGQAAGHRFYVMDYISGHPLDRYMASAAPSIRETLELFAKICEAVHAAHLHGVVHRDLKPGNIIVDAEGEPHVLDFGLAKIAAGEVTGAPRPQLMTVTGQFIGSLPWASPEQAEGVPEHIDIRTDVYSLGVILFQILTGQFPYRVVGNMHDVLENIVRAPPARAGSVRRQIDNEVETIVLKCLSKERERRYQGAGPLAHDIRHYLAGEPIEAKRDSGWYMLRKSLRRHKLAAAAAAGYTLVITLAAAGLWTLYRATAEAREESEVVTTFLTDMLASADPLHEGRDVTVRGVLDDAARQIGAEFADHPVIEARLRDTLGRTYQSLGLLDDAEPQWLLGVEIRKRTLGEDDLRTVESTAGLGWLYRAQGRFDEAEPLLTRALERYRDTYGAEHPDTLEMATRLALLYWSDGREAEAEALQRKTLDAQRRVLGDDHRDTLRSMHSLGTLYGSRGRLDEAEPILRKTLERRRVVRGEEHPDTLATMNNLALVYAAQGRHAEAEALQRRTLDIERRLLGEEHPATAQAMMNLANAYLRQERWEEARPLYVGALAIQRRVLGDDHPDTLWSMNNLAWFLLTCEPEVRRDPRQALALAGEANEAAAGGNPSYLDTLALAQYANGDTRRAIECQRQALDALSPGDSAARDKMADRLARYLEAIDEVDLP